jgi:hypothetical protein
MCCRRFTPQYGSSTFLFGEKAVRVAAISSEPWFVGKDVATVLGYSDTVREVRLGQQREAGDAGIVDQDVDAAILLGDPTNGSFPLGVMQGAGHAVTGGERKRGEWRLTLSIIRKAETFRSQLRRTY